MKRCPRWLTASLGFALCAAFSSPGQARVSEDFSYTKQQTYSAALRFLRVDKGFEIVERDADAAYLIFSYPAPGQNGEHAQGTVEVIEVKDRVKLIVQLPRMPEYHEQLLADGLKTKLKREYGDPPKRKTKAAPSKKSEKDNRPQGDEGSQKHGEHSADPSEN